MKWSDFTEAFPVFLTATATPANIQHRDGFEPGIAEFHFSEIGKRAGERDQRAQPDSFWDGFSAVSCFWEARSAKLLEGSDGGLLVFENFKKAQHSNELQGLHYDF